MLLNVWLVKTTSTSTNLICVRILIQIHKDKMTIVPNMLPMLKIRLVFYVSKNTILLLVLILVRSESNRLLLIVML